MPESELCEVYSAVDSHEAHLMRNLLEDAGIEALVVGDHLQNAVGDLPAVAIAPRLLVRSGDLLQARSLIEDQLRRQRSSDKGAAWTCSTCGAPNEASFEICWKCLAPRDVDES